MSGTVLESQNSPQTSVHLHNHTQNKPFLQFSIGNFVSGPHGRQLIMIRNYQKFLTIFMRSIIINNINAMPAKRMQNPKIIIKYRESHE
jgi:hypothetical protein